MRQAKERRDNRTMRAIVNFGVELAKSSKANAAEYLSDHRVPIAVAKRVLIGRKS